MFADPGGRVPDYFVRHPARPVPPRLISHFIHIAVITGQIASTVDLNDEFPERNRTPSIGHHGLDIKGQRPFESEI